MADLNKWKLFIDRGRQVWKYDPQATSQEFWEKYLLDLDVSKEAPDTPAPKNTKEALEKAIKFYQKLQTSDGHWANDYGGPLFLMPGLVICCYIVGAEISEEQKYQMKRYLGNRQNSDGGWGLHVEDKSTIFGTCMNYVLLRLIGMDKDHEVAAKARKFLLDNGGARYIPSWGKFWLATLGLYDWQGLNPLIPEMWLLPYWFPMHPGRFWCHCRIVYLPMCYIYGRKATLKENDLIRQLKKEIYVEDYDKINWPAQKWVCSDLDYYVRPTWFLKLVFGLISIYERFHFGWLRRRALNEVIDHVRLEDRSTKYICIGPVNKAINMLCNYYADGTNTSEAVKKHIDRVPDYLWLAGDGMKMQGYNGCQLWDTAFALQAILEAGMHEEFKETLIQGHHYLEITQVMEDVPNAKKYYRHISKGAWPFSTRDHGWPISDCTSEGLKAALGLRKLSFIKPLEDQRYFDAVNVILSLQNTDGGWATYENKRGGNWIEWLNPSEVFYDIMVDYSYVECTSACIQALLKFQQSFPDHRTEEIKRSVRRGITFIKKIQKTDGSWRGSWAACFTYGTWFGVEGLVAVGEKYATSPALRKACKFLVDKQREDGGWGEDFQSCVKQSWVEKDVAQTVPTSWALLSLITADYPHKAVIDKGIKHLIEKQLKNGDWKLEGISGVFNANCAISYNSYKNVFSIWALARYRNKYGDFNMTK